MQNQQFRCLIKAWAIWVVAASFYAYEFFLRISPTVMVADLMRAFSVDAAILGNLSAIYYYAYASMQIPAGMLLDRFGIRPLLTCAAGLVAIGSILFAAAHQLALAELGRVCMGVGSAFSFIGCLKLARNWFPASQLAIVIGLTNTLGVIGALSGEAPLALLINHVGWREALFLASIIGACLALIIQWFVRDKPQMLGCTNINKNQKPHRPSFWQGLCITVRCPHIWLIALYGGLMVAPISAFTELWSVPFFMQIDHINRANAAALSSLVFIGIAIGGPLNGWISGKTGRRKPVMIAGCLGALICFTVLINLPQLPILFLSLLLCLFGFFTSSMLLAFSMNTERHPTAVTGVIIGFTNMLVMAGGTIFQPLVGYLLDASIPTTASNRALNFSLTNYQHALFILSVCQMAALVLISFTRESFKK